MADKRKPECRIIIEESRRRVAVELFPARMFPGGEGLDDQFRARVGRRWLRPGGRRYVFWTKADILAWLFWLADGRPPLSPTPVPAPCADPSPAPELPKGSPVAVANGRISPEGAALRDKTFTMTEPFQGVDGRWRVFLVGRREPALVENLSR
ncbi:hypothetical protein DSECCO2_496700 [anaerobic digester metagenome]